MCVYVIPAFLIGTPVTSSILADIDLTCGKGQNYDQLHTKSWYTHAYNRYDQ